MSQSHAISSFLSSISHVVFHQRMTVELYFYDAVCALIWGTLIITCDQDHQYELLKSWYQYPLTLGCVLRCHWGQTLYYLTYHATTSYGKIYKNCRKFKSTENKPSYWYNIILLLYMYLHSNVYIYNMNRVCVHWNAETHPHHTV